MTANQNEIDAAYWLWLREYAQEPRTPPRGSLESARTALLLTLEAVAQRMGVRASTLKTLEKRESQGRATLASLAEAADALGCEFGYFLIPKRSGDRPKDFSEVVWGQIWPEAVKNERVRMASPETRVRAIAAVARELLHSPEFRRQKNWSRRRT